MDEETQLVEYCLYMANRGLPLRRWMVLGLAQEIDASKSQPTFDPEAGPSDGWWRRFCLRHPEISLRVTSKLDGGRFCMAHKSVVDRFFKMVTPLYWLQCVLCEQFIHTNCDNCNTYATFICSVCWSK